MILTTVLVDYERVIFLTNQCLLSLFHEFALIWWNVIIVIAFSMSHWNFGRFRIMIHFDFSDLDGRIFLLTRTWTRPSFLWYWDSLRSILLLNCGWLRAISLKRPAVAIQTTFLRSLISQTVYQIWISGLRIWRPLTLFLKSSLDSDICDLASLTCLGSDHRGGFGVFVCSINLKTSVNRGCKIQFSACRGCICSSTLCIVLIVLIIPYWALTSFYLIISRGPFTTSYEPLHTTWKT